MMSTLNQLAKRMSGAGVLGTAEGAEEAAEENGGAHEEIGFREAEGARQATEQGWTKHGPCIREHHTARGCETHFGGPDVAHDFRQKHAVPTTRSRTK